MLYFCYLFDIAQITLKEVLFFRTKRVEFVFGNKNWTRSGLYIKTCASLKNFNGNTLYFGHKYVKNLKSNSLLKLHSRKSIFLLQTLFISKNQHLRKLFCI